MWYFNWILNCLSIAIRTCFKGYYTYDYTYIIDIIYISTTENSAWHINLLNKGCPFKGKVIFIWLWPFISSREHDTKLSQNKYISVIPTCFNREHSAKEDRGIST